MIFSIYGDKLWQTEIPKGTKIALALGCFDGVHLGHKALLEAIQNADKETSPAIWTFSAPLTRPYIENIESRIKLCQNYGVRFAICESFERFRMMPRTDFVKYLAELGVTFIACGQDYRFGYERKGNPDFLQSECKQYGIKVKIVPNVTAQVKGKTEKVSSTLIRGLIKEGEMSEVARLLGRPFQVSGVIVSGNNLGRTIQVPTINQRFEAGRIVPRHGVYASVCTVEGIDYPSITNIGTRPTVLTGSHEENCETHIIGQRLELYGKIAEVKLFDFVREEKKYESLDELRTQIDADIEKALEFFERKR